ncbi:MAG: ribonuclease HII [Trueperaceae bacterium]
MTARSAPVGPPDWRFESILWRDGVRPVAGVDEAGRGALAGPIVAAAVILPHGAHPFRDSKTIPAPQRERWAREVREIAFAWGVGFASAAEVDRHGVPSATLQAALRAIRQLSPAPAGLVTDYLRIPGPYRVLAPARADAASLQAAAASLLAKTERDRWMREVADATWPAYGFARHKGYGVRDHLAALHAHGPCDLHRRRFAPVAQAGLFAP